MINTDTLCGKLEDDLIIISRLTEESINSSNLSGIKACGQVTFLSSLPHNSRLMKGEKNSLGLMALNIWKH